jgi:D-3-phosphoglycerate dehydrogenase
MKYNANWVKLPCKTLSEVVVGIIGCGNVGLELVRKLVGLNVGGIVVNDLIDKTDVLEEVCRNRGGVRFTFDRNLVLQNADFVCVCCDYRKGNYHLIDNAEINAMKSGSYLINMARGSLVNLNAVTEALVAKHLAGVALDVFEHEPLSEMAVIRRLPNVLLSSHNANSSPKYWLKVHLNTIRNALGGRTVR